MFENITLEVSLKPFKQTDNAYIQEVCAHIFDHWKPLLKGRKRVSVMLWVGDGSEILDYAGNLDDTFEWARFVGTANLPLLAEEAPRETSLHERKQEYMQNAPRMTYRILKNIVSVLKEEGKKAYPDATIRVAETFDIGPEFAISDFRYRRHTEICTGSTVQEDAVQHKMIEATALLHADDRRYAAYPKGIPEGTPFGTFLGKQSECFLTDLGFDYLWLSNGLGFSSDPWKRTGKIFDGKNYFPQKLSQISEKVFNFWKLFRKECTFPLEVRGTNNSVGIDYASDGVPLWDIYHANLDITAPPNSPWAALNDNYGLEMMGHMTRVAELPNSKFPFRYYLHDPWWINSPWYDRYDESPCDIYLPMSISRITSDGTVEGANSLNILSIDTSYGEMPDACVYEPLPHLLKAEKNTPDEVAPLVWVYPMREYTTSHDAQLLCEMNLGDNYICAAINNGLPLCCVVSTDNFLLHRSDVYQKSILISPVPENTAVQERLTELAESGIGVIFYGTKEKLRATPTADRIFKLDVAEPADQMLSTLGNLGYSIHFSKREEDVKPPTMAISRSDNAIFFSVYNANTTTDTHLRFLQGAPILCGAETKIENGHSTYRFSRGEQRECRVFVEQSDGVISVREAPPINTRYRRAIKIAGLSHATVRLFPEKGCPAAVSIAPDTDSTPIFDTRFHLVHDEKIGTYLQGDDISGKIYFLMEHISP